MNQPSTLLDLRIITYCAEEVARQQAGPLAVAWMCEAWLRAFAMSGESPIGITSERIEELGSLVDPVKNRDGFRRCGVRVGSYIAPPAADVPRLISQLVDAIPRLTAAEFYREYQEVHPFRDGNGRTGKLLFNWLNGTLSAPILPPNFFGCANP